MSRQPLQAAGAPDAHQITERGLERLPPSWPSSGTPWARRGAGHSGRRGTARLGGEGRAGPASPPLPSAPAPPAPPRQPEARVWAAAPRRAGPRQAASRRFRRGGMEEWWYRSASGARIALRRRQHSASCRELAVRCPRLRLRSLSAATSAAWLAAYGLFVLTEVPTAPRAAPRTSPPLRHRGPEPVSH